jgi:hypothetical protein
VLFIYKIRLLHLNLKFTSPSDPACAVLIQRNCEEGPSPPFSSWTSSTCTGSNLFFFIIHEEKFLSQSSSLSTYVLNTEVILLRLKHQII